MLFWGQVAMQRLAHGAAQALIFFQSDLLGLTFHHFPKGILFQADGGFCKKRDLKGEWVGYEELFENDHSGSGFFIFLHSKSTVF